MEVRTEFDSRNHGYRFANRFQGGAVLAEITRQDRLSELSGLKVPRAVRHLTDLAAGEDFWGTFGLCGGMSWTAVDRFERGETAPDTSSIPGPETGLFTELVARQADSMKGRDLLERCIVWQMFPDVAPWWTFWLKGVGRLTVEGEWPKLRSALDAGQPTPLVLIRAQGVTMPDKHHQVVAIGYKLTDGNAVVSLYDPNHPGSTPEIALDLAGGKVGPRQSTGEVVRGIFVWTSN